MIRTTVFEYDANNRRTAEIFDPIDNPVTEVSNSSALGHRITKYDFNWAAWSQRPYTAKAISSGLPEAPYHRVTRRYTTDLNNRQMQA